MALVRPAGVVDVIARAGRRPSPDTGAAANAMNRGVNATRYPCACNRLGRSQPRTVLAGR